MGVHKRYISNNQTLDIYNEQGIEGVKNWYTSGVDILITEEGLSSTISDLLLTTENNSPQLWDKITQLIKTQT